MKNLIVGMLVATVISGCATMTPYGQDPKIRGIEGRTESCLMAAVGPWQRVDCGRIAEQDCLAQGLEKNCGIDWTEDNRRPW